ncbi:hypothetical protein [Ruminiclostridium cellulolyticum]|uniref:Uncharacterized protein n=1 Tax=Ruminiclostridium cellulolyticum (strain ATCC 35319 / DSM 5812 / JCM 6584 / H10) TaxID=394503 RepID=B8I1W9_RUMCH|nr:hypothetical protein [Ruminiclostridium cellulolyticum]ACL75795.1 hypothetical protein Ccel_1441 [Ruminiclostridium cellulolyticum H10]
MDNKQLQEIKDRLAVLPALEHRMESLRKRITEAKNNVNTLLRKFEAETLDVENIKKDSLTNSLRKLLGKYEGKINKETQEMLTAKLEYDRAVENVKVLSEQESELKGRISELNELKRTQENELAKREEFIKNNISADSFKMYMEIEQEHEFLFGQVVETQEAIGAANKVLITADNAMEHLNKAEDLATLDVWLKGGILTHNAKYSHIEEAQRYFNILNSQVKAFETELNDVNMQASYLSCEIDSTTRAVDFWFDNIFTDLKVRDKIQSDAEDLRDLIDKINRTLRILETKRKELKKNLSDNESRKADLIASIEI